MGWVEESTPIPVIPAEAGIQAVFKLEPKRTWMPALAGMTNLYLRSLRPFGYAQDMLCGKYSEPNV